MLDSAEQYLSAKGAHTSKHSQHTLRCWENDDRPCKPACQEFKGRNKFAPLHGRPLLAPTHNRSNSLPPQTIKQKTNLFHHCISTNGTAAMYYSTLKPICQHWSGLLSAALSQSEPSKPRSTRTSLPNILCTYMLLPAEAVQTCAALLCKSRA